MKASQLGLGARRVCSSLWARLWTHVLTAGTMAVALFVFGALMLAQENLQNLLTGWGDQMQLNAYLDKGLGAGEVSLLRDKIQSLPEVGRVRYISPEEAWKDFRGALGPHSNVLSGLPEDILPASFEIFVRSTIGLAILAQKDEIEVMQLVGATEELIQAPFVVEGLIQGFIGAGLSVLGLWLLVLSLREQIPTSMVFFGGLGELQFIQWRSVALILAIGSLLGASGSVFSLRRFMKRWNG